MALPTITIATDFVGEIKINVNPYQSSELSAYVTQFYEDFVRSIIGSEATDTIVNQDPLAQKWVDLFAGVYYYNTAMDKRIQTKGLTYSVLRVLYFYFRRDDFNATQSGNVKAKTEVSMRLNPHEVAQLVSTKYNRAMQVINHDLQDWLLNYRSYEGTIDSFVDNGGGSYTINSSDTIYLADGDTVTINNVDYTVSNLVDDTSFDISGDTGLSFSGVYVYSPFEIVDFHPQEYIIA